MGKHDVKSKGADEETVSMNSLGNLHGRVDFFGIETRKANKPIYQKLKVIQTWIFIQALLITAMLAYLILLSVWMAPFFPMNYDTDEEAESNTAKIQRLQGQVANNTDRIKELEEWKASQSQNNNMMLATISELQTERALLNATVQEFQDQVHLLRLEKEMLEEEVVDLLSFTSVLNGSSVALESEAAFWRTQVDGMLSRLDELDGGDSLLSDTRASDTERKMDNYHTRLMKLECFKDGIKGIVKEANKGIEEKLCNLSMTVGDMLEGGSGDTDRLDELEGKLDATAQGLRDHAKWTRNNFVQQDDLRAAGLEKARIATETGIGKLQCAVQNLNDTVFGNLGKHKHFLLNKIGETADAARTHVETTFGALTEQFESAKADIQERAMEIVKTGIASALDHVTKEKELRQNQYVHLCDRIDEVIENTTIKFEETNVMLDNAFFDIDNLNSTLQDMEAENERQDEQLSNLEGNITSNAWDFIQFQAETAATEQDFEDRICKLENETDTNYDLIVRLGVRMNNTEVNVNEIANELARDILNSEGSVLADIAELGRKNNNMTAEIAQIRRQYAQLKQDLGDDFTAQIIRDIQNLLGGNGSTPSEFAPPEEADYYYVPVARQDTGIPEERESE